MLRSLIAAAVILAIPATALACEGHENLAGAVEKAQLAQAAQPAPADAKPEAKAAPRKAKPKAKALSTPKAEAKPAEPAK